MARGSENVTLTLRADATQALAELKRVDSALKKTGETSKRTGDSFQAAQEKLEDWGPAARRTLAVVTGAAVATTAAFASFEKETVNVQNILSATDKEMTKFTDHIMELPPTLGEADDLMRGLYQTISAGITEPAEAMAVLESSAITSKGNFADLSTTIKATASIMNAYGLQADQVTSIQDAMTKTVDIGVLTFDDLAENIGKGTAIAKLAGVSYQELLATLATLTLNGLGVEESMTAIRNILVRTITPTAAQAEQMNELGVELSVSALKTQGLAGFMGTLAESVRGNAEAMSALFPNMRAFVGVAQLASEEGAGKLAGQLDLVSESAGKSADNFARSSATIQQQTQAMVAELKKLGIEFGALLAEDIRPMIRGLTGLISAMREMDPAWKSMIISVGKAAAAASAAVLVLPKLIKGGVALGGALKAIGPAGAVAAGGARAFTAALGPAVIAGLALNVAIDQLAKHINRASDEMLKASKEMQDGSAALHKALERQFGSIEKAAKATGRSARQIQIWLKAVKEGKEISTPLARNLIWLTDQFQKSADQANAATEAQEGLSTAQEQAASNLIDHTKTLEKHNAAIDETIKQTENAIRLAKENTRLIDESLGLGRAMEIYAAGWEDVGDSVDDAVFSLQDLFKLAEKDLVAPSFDDSDFSRQVQEMSDIMRSEFGWAVTDGLTDGFAEFTPERFAKDWASMISELIGSQLQDVLSGKEGAGGGFRNIMEAIQQNPAMFGLGGAGMVFGAATGPQAGTTGGIVQGMVGGATTGAAVGGWVGAVVGAIIGGVLASQGDESPETRATLGFAAGQYYATSATRGGQGISGTEHGLFQQKLIGAFSELKIAYRGLLQIFEDESLFALVGDLPEFDSQGWLGMSIDELGKWLTEAFLPEGFENQFQSAIEMGLGRLGVGQEAMDALWNELSQLAGGQRIGALSTFIQAIVDSSRLLEDLDFENIMEAVGQTPREAFVEMMQNTLDQVDLSMVGWDQLTLLEQAREAQNIQQLVEQARLAEIQYLQQIVQLGDQINRSIGMQIEQLQVGGMGRQQQAEFFTSQLDLIFDTLAAGGLDPNQIAQLTGDAQRYINQLGGVFGEDLDTMLATMFGLPGTGQQPFLDAFGGLIGTGETGRSFLIALLEHLRGLSGGAMDEVITEAEDLSGDFEDRMRDVLDRLFDFQGAVGDSGPIVKEWGGEMAEFSMRIVTATGALEGFIGELERLVIPTPPSGRESDLKSGGDNVVINIDSRIAPFIRLTRQIIRQEIGSQAYQGTS